MKIRGQEILDPKVRLMSFVVKDDAGCWLWTGATAPNGYGRLTIGSRIDGTRRTVSAHRYSLFVFRRIVVPRGKELCHRCDVRRCINPDHIFVGTRQDNVDDREAKGRNKPALTGSLNLQAKLTEPQVAEARSLHTLGIGWKRLARKYGVHKKTIAEAVCGKTWKHVPIDPAPPRQDGGSTK